ncbi:hypothetical protein FNV43_RR04612 [Rhamnella rubrinervis]|uniref:Uncharacterized protein n=1 Tax=Rhamnella rubrinervis TaxID=2594499 RepID=A0A8K0HKL7_9ROSA|nr:hypothetical protein FNV43_RR04612 [Rhamnella rubrinervis]
MKWNLTFGFDRDIGKLDIVELRSYVFPEEIRVGRSCLDQCVGDEDCLKEENGEEKLCKLHCRVEDQIFDMPARKR